MPDKIKISRKEIEDMYDIEEEEKKVETVNVSANADYEEFTEYYDEKQLKERKENA